MANKSIVGVKNAGFLMPTDYLSRAVKDAGYLGTAVVHEGKLVINHQPTKQTVDQIQKVQEHFKDSTVIFCFGENSKTKLPEDQLPFLCQLSKDKGDEVAVFLEGNFEGYSVKGSSHIDAFHAFDDYISKKLQKLYKGASSDLEEFLKELNDDLVKQELSNSWTSRGFISLLTSSGKAATIFNKGNFVVRQFPWGTVSDNLGYEEKSETAATPVEKEKPVSLLDKLMAKKEAPKVSVPPVDPKKTEASVAAITAATTDDKFEEVNLPPEAKNWTNKDKIKWWVAEVGYKPNGYKDLKTKVKRTKGTKRGVLADLADANGDIPAVVNQEATAVNTEAVNDKPVKMEAKTEVKAQNPNKVDPKTLPDKVAPENAKDTSPKHVSIDNLPILGPKQKLLLKKDFLADNEIVKILGDDFQQMAMAPKQLKELEDNYQTFHDGLGMEKMPYLTFDALMKLGAIDLKSLCVLAFNNQNDRVAAEIKLSSITKANPNLKLAM